MTIFPSPVFTPRSDIHVGLNINHPIQLDSIKEFTAQHLGEYSKSLKLVQQSTTLIQVQLIPECYSYEVFKFQQTQVTLIRSRTFSEDVLKILNIENKNVFTKFSLPQFILALEIKQPGSLLYRCRKRDEFICLYSLLRNYQFSFYERTVVEIPISTPIKMHLLSHRVDNIVLDFFWVDPIEELGAKNKGLVDQKITEILPHSSFDYNELDKYGEHLKILKNSTTITFGN